jgi:hypothetical protein
VQRLSRELIEANLLEISGDRTESPKKYRLLKQELSKQPGALKDSADGAISRLSRK